MISFWHSFVYAVVVCIPVGISIITFINYWTEFMTSALEHSVRGEEFDFIIIGGGSAGAVLANRLSEEPSYKVLLLEAGGAPIFITGIPALASQLQLSPYDWQHKTVPQKHACGAMEGRKCAWPSGKMLGGSSGINYMLYTRGHPADYDGWADAGNPGWSFHEIKKYFLKSERNIGNHPGGHGRDGYLPVDDARYTTPLEKEYIKMVQDEGYQVKDLNIASNQTGFMVPHVTLDNGRRGDTYRSYLKPVLDRPNLWIRKHARAVNIDIKKGKAVGVTFTRYGEEVYVKAKKEVLVSAGTVNSAKLLMLSGIGPKKHLDKLGIQVKADLPVGQNLQDHLTTMLGPFIVNDSVTFEPARLLNYFTFQDYILSGDGPMTAACAIDLIGFINSQNNTRTENPDIQLMFLSSSLSADYFTHLYKTFRLEDRIVWDEYFIKFYYPKNMNQASILPVLVHPKSVGEVKLKSKNPSDSPLVNPRYLSEPEDADVLVEAILETLDMVNNSQHLNKLDYKMPPIHFPGCEKFDLFSEKYWKCYVSQVSLTMYHPVGTCKMAPDNTGVMNYELKVKGVERLRVVDASIMPKIVSANTNAPVIMIAEKASDMIKSTWPVSKSKSHKKDEL